MLTCSAHQDVLFPIFLTNE